jgi:hypothetical protein
MNMTRFDTPPGRPLWLATLADLSLLLVGFFVFLQATQHLDRGALAAGIRAGFDAPAEAPMPVEAAAMNGFAAGSAALPADDAGAVAFVHDAAQDPRIAVTLTGATEGKGDVDQATGAAAVLALDRARAVAALLIAQGAVHPDRIAFAPAATGTRGVRIDLGFAGDDRQAVADRQLPVAAPVEETTR